MPSKAIGEQGEPGTMTYRYPWRAIAPDYARALAGLGCTGVPAVFMDLPAVVTAVLAFLATIFLLFGLQAALRHGTRVRVSEREICAHPLGASVPLRLRELGFVPGTPVSVVRNAPLRDPVEVELRGYRICLRRSELATLCAADGHQGA